MIKFFLGVGVGIIITGIWHCFRARDLKILAIHEYLQDSRWLR